MGIAIKDAQLVEQVTGSEKIPVSDGSGQPKTVTSGQLKEYIGKGYIKPSSGIPKTDLASDVQDSLNKADSALQKESLSDYATKEELAKKAEGSIDVLDNGNIKVTINGVSKDFMPATPSGDAMHHYYEGYGAVYNNGDDYITETEWADLVDDIEYNAAYGLNLVTGVKVKTIPYKGVEYEIYEQGHYRLGNALKVWVVGVKSQNGTLVYDDTKVVHRKGYWLFNSMGDLTNEDMREIVNQGVRYVGNPYCFAYLNSEYSSYKGRTNMNVYFNVNEINKNGLTGIFYHSFIDVASLKDGSISKVKIKANLNFSGPANKHCIGREIIPINSGTFTSNIYLSTTLIGGINVSFKIDCPSISKKSILYAINNENATSVCSIVLRQSAYNRISNQPDIVEALSNHPLISLASI